LEEEMAVAVWKRGWAPGNGESAKSGINTTRCSTCMPNFFWWTIISYDAKNKLQRIFCLITFIYIWMYSPTLMNNWTRFTEKWFSDLETARPTYRNKILEITLNR
jgi:hypothetical protein